MKFYGYNLTLSIDNYTFTDKTCTHPVVVNCLNPHSFVTAESDPAFKEALRSSDLLLPDGIGICNAVRRWRHTRIRKIAGDDFHRHILNQLEQHHGRVFYMGSMPHVLGKIEQRIRKEYPHIAVATHSPSFCAEFSDAENRAIVEKIEAFAPDVLWVGMTAPKQEKWVHSQLRRLTTPKVIGNIGAVFDFYAGTKQRAPRWMIALRLEWLARLLLDPRRMWRRIFVSAPQFILYNLRHHKAM